MKKTRRGFIIIVFSTAFLCIYLNIPRLLGKIGNRVMNVKVLSMEEIDLMCEGKEDAFMEPEITLGGAKLPMTAGRICC